MLQFLDRALNHLVKGKQITHNKRLIGALIALHTLRSPRQVTRNGLIGLSLFALITLGMGLLSELSNTAHVVVLIVGALLALPLYQPPKPKQRHKATSKTNNV